MGVLKVYDGSAWQEVAVASGDALWVQDVDNDLTTTDDITSGSGTWTIGGGGTLQCATASSTACKAYDDSASMSQGTITMLQAEVQVPASATSGTQFALIGLMDPADVSAIGHLLFGGVNFAGGASGAYVEEEGLLAITDEAYTVPSAGTWVTMRVLLAGNRISLWLDDVLVATAQSASIGDDKAAPQFVPTIKAYSSTGVTVVFRNLKAWSLNPDPTATAGVGGTGTGTGEVPAAVRVLLAERFS